MSSTSHRGSRRPMSFGIGFGQPFPIPSLSLKAYSKPPSALTKCLFASFQNTAHFFTNVRFFQATSHVGNGRQTSRRVRPGASDNDLIGICVDHQIRIMRHDDHLSLPLGLNEKRDQFIKNRFWIEVLLRLVNDERPIVGVVKRKIEKQQNNSA